MRVIEKVFHVITFLFLNFLFISLDIEFVDGSLMEVKAPLEKCQESDLEACSSTAESLIKDPGLIFPDKPSTLDRVCRMWETLTTCIDNYTTKCYTRADKFKFDRLFNDSIAAMTVVCTDQNYRNDYLKYAPCVKRVTTNGEHCGFPYQVLIDQISNTQVTIKQLCCARTKFKNCILSKTKEVCDNRTGSSLVGEKIPIGSAKPMNITMFAQQVVDKSLAFIAQQCAKIKTGTLDCDMGISILRPNSKGPLTPDGFFQSNVTSAQSGQPIASGTSTKNKFQTGDSSLEKPSGNSLNSVGQGAEKLSPNFQLNGSKGAVKESTVTGLSPKVTVSKTTELDKPDNDKPHNDKLKLHNAGFGFGSNSDGEEGTGSIILPSSLFVGIFTSWLILA